MTRPGTESERLETASSGRVSDEKLFALETAWMLLKAAPEYTSERAIASLGLKLDGLTVGAMASELIAARKVIAAAAKTARFGQRGLIINSDMFRDLAEALDDYRQQFPVTP